MPDPTHVEDVRDLVQTARVVAVLGAHAEPARAAFYVPDDLHGAGARILPVNPGLVGNTLWGETVRASLADIDERVDVVDVFRRSEALAGHLDELLAMVPRPRAVWFQLGIRDDAVAEALRAEGIAVVQDRCLLADRRALGIHRIG